MSKYTSTPGGPVWVRPKYGLGNAFKLGKNLTSFETLDKKRAM